MEEAPCLTEKECTRDDLIDATLEELTKRALETEKWIEVFKETIEEIVKEISSCKVKSENNSKRIKVVLDGFEQHCWTPDAHNPGVVSKKLEKARRDSDKN